MNRIVYIFVWFCAQFLAVTIQHPTDPQHDEFGYYEDNADTEIGCTIDRFGTRLCDCGYGNQKKYLPRMFGSVGDVQVINCKHLYVKRDTFIDVNDLQRLSFVNIEELVLDENAFSIRSDRNLRSLEFRNVHVEEVPTHFLNGSLVEMVWDNCRIGVLRPFTMINTGTRFRTIRIHNSWIYKVDAQAFKKLQVETFDIVNSTFSESLPSRSFYDLEVNEQFRITDSRFSHVHSSAIILKDVKRFELTNNQFDRINGDAFVMHVNGDVWIRNNEIRSIHSMTFAQITINPTYLVQNQARPVFYMTSNRVETIQDTFNLLLAPEFDVKIVDLKVTDFMLCYQVQDVVNPVLVDNAASVLIRVKDASMSADFVDLASILGGLCNSESRLVYIIAGSVTLLVLLLLLVIGIGCFCYCRRRRKLEIVLPEGKTYRETQIVMQIENHGLLKTDL